VLSATALYTSRVKLGRSCWTFSTAHHSRGGNLGRVGFDTRSFFPGMAGHPCPTLRAIFLPSKESHHILERDNLGPPVVPGGQIGLGSRNLHVPRGAPSLRSGWVIGTDRRMSEPPCARQEAPLAKRRVGLQYSLSYAGPRVPRGGVTRQGVVLTDFQSLVECQ
jgi:hypothetical protein